MNKPYGHLAATDQLERFLIASQQMNYELRHFQEAHNRIIGIGDNTTLSIERTALSAEAIVFITQHKDLPPADRARFRINDVRNRGSLINILDEKLDAVDPEDIPVRLSSLETQTDLAFLAIGYARKLRIGELTNGN